MSDRVALAHDWFVNRGGAERVALALARIYPDAPMFTALAFPEATFPEVAALDLRTSPLQQRIDDPSRFRRLLLRYPKAWSALAAKDYDAVIASTTAFAHQIRTDGCLIAYCHQPPRFLYDPVVATNLAPNWAKPLLPLVQRRLRTIDQQAAGRVHRYVANSRTTARRIQSTYGVRATVVHPPVDVDKFSIAPRTSDHWLVVSRLLRHRDIDLAVDAFNELGIPLMVVGDGPDRARLEARAESHISFLGAVDDATLIRLYGESRGVVVPGVEDLGLVALEAAASGRPVVARGSGGSLETVIDSVTGSFFLEPAVSAVVRAVRKAMALEVDPETLREHAKGFDRSLFEARMSEIVAARDSCLRCQRRSR